MTWFPVLVRGVDRGGQPVLRLGHPQLDRYLGFVAARARSNTVLATGYDLKVFFAVVAKEPAEVNTADVLEFITIQRGDRRVVRLVDQVTLHKALDAAVRKGMLATNPADLADKVKVPPRDVTETVWSPETMTTFLSATATDRLHPIWQTACMTGFRRSELAGLQWPDIDLDGGLLSVKRARTQVDGQPVVKGPKSAASRRMVDLDSETVIVLRRWKVAQLEERLRAGTAWQPGDWVFTDQIGAPWRPDRLTRAFVDRACALGLPATDVKGLRHAHATALLRAGVHPKVVQERLGHSSISVTMDIYSSVLPGMQREAVEKLASLMDSLGAR